MPLNIGIVGTGSAVNRLHLPVLKRMPEAFRVVAVANRTREKAEKVAAEVGCSKIYDHYEALLDDPKIDAVLTAVPIELNCQVLIDAIRAGKHVLAEKPMTATLIEARAVLQACKHSAKVVAIGENFRYREDVAQARELIASNTIGHVSCFQVSSRYDVTTEFRRPWFEKGTWRHSPTFPGGMVADSGIHIISATSDILGEAKEVFARVLQTSKTTEGPDCLLAQLTMVSGAVGHYLACYTAKVAKEGVFDLVAYGTEGSLHLTEGEVFCESSVGNQTFCCRPEGYDRGYTRQWQNFYRAIRGEEALLSTPAQAYRDLLLMDAALRSAALNELVQLDCPDEEITAVASRKAVVDQ